MKIKTYKGKLIQQPHFFILNKGMNTGKPDFKPYANCFVLLADTDKERNFYYWLCFALWQTERFTPYLTGSAVPFIRIRDLKTVISDAEIKVKRSEKEYQEFLSQLIEIDSLTEALFKQLKNIKEMKKSIFKRMLR